MGDAAKKLVDRVTDARFHPDAQREFVKSGVRYEALRPGFGERFIARVDDVVAGLSAAPTDSMLRVSGSTRLPTGYEQRMLNTNVTGAAARCF